MSEKQRRVMLVGWDGADWKVIHPLLDSGKMPNLQRVVERGVIGNLATLRPLLSPMVWTSIATGKRAEKHGIHGFTEPDPVRGGIRPVTVLSRRTKALWNILTQSGRQSIVVGWWPSHPAEPIAGVMVSNAYQTPTGEQDAPGRLRPGTVHPPELMEPLEKFRVHPAELTAEHLGHFVPRIAEVDQEKDHRLWGLAKTTADCTSIHGVTTALMQNEPWDFLAVYFDSIDHYSHAFMHYHPPRLSWIPEEKFDLYGSVIEGAYRYHDLMLGTLLALAGEDTTVVIVSDHGFHSDDLRPREIPGEPAGPAAQHRPLGIFAMAGPGVRRDERVYGASVLDVAPTILSLFGLPVGRDMDGKVLVEAFEEPPEVEVVESWDDIAGEDGRHPPDRHLDPAASREAIEQLVALGYIDPPEGDEEQAAEVARREMSYNLAQSLMDAHRHAEAAEILAGLRERWPYEHRFGLRLLQCLQELGHPKEARDLLEEVLRRKAEDAEKARGEIEEFHRAHEGTSRDELPAKELAEYRRLRSRASPIDPYAVRYLTGRLLLSEDRPEEALPHFEAVASATPGKPDIHLALGDTCIALEKPARAVAFYERALDLDPESEAAWLGLARAHLGAGRSEDAVRAGLRSVGILFHQPVAHYFLGVALRRTGRPEEAAKALRLSLSQNPNNPKAHRLLASILEEDLGDPEAGQEHREAALSAREQKGRAVTIQLGVATPDQAVQDPAPPPVPEPGSVDLSRTVVVVSGLPRSGTSLMMQMLAAGGVPPYTDDTRAADEDNPRGYFETERAKGLRKNRSWLAETAGRAVKIVAPLLPLLPSGNDYRVVFMERDLGEVLASQRAMLVRQGHPGPKLPEDRLAKECARQVGEAKRWLAARGIPFLVVGHEESISGPASVAERVSAFLGGGLAVEPMAAVVKPELYRQRKGPAGD